VRPIGILLAHELHIVDLFLNELKADEKVFMYEFLLLAVVVIYVAISYGSGAH